MIRAAILVAAGKGERAGGGLPKQYRPLGGKPVIRWSLETLAARTGRLIAVIDPAHADLFAAAATGLDVETVPGGAQRTDSVRAGLSRIDRADTVLIHDAARPGLTPAIIDRLHTELLETPAAAPALPVADALKRVSANGAIIEESPRAGLVRIQTPQAFRFPDLKRAYAALPEGASFEDDLAVLRAAGVDARIVPGDPKLMKLTHPEDFAVLESMLAAQNTDKITVTGSGFDAHRFGDGDHVTLCGVRIPHTRGIIGHSDADVGWHALTDALLGAISAGDIGLHFPPSDPKWRGANSEIFLKHAAGLVAQTGGAILHVDLTLICERPKIGPHREAMRARTAEALGLPLQRVSIKATTTERMGFAGREEGLAAQATASVSLPA